MKPILFNTEMVKAILDGRKTVTRRLVKFKAGQNPQWTGYVADGPVLYGSHNIPAVKAPFHTGDILYVRETYCKDAGRYMYRANYAAGEHFYRNGKEVVIRWSPSIHMPKEAARIFLRVKEVRVERLNDITEAGAINEGVPNEWPMEPIYCPVCKGEGSVGALHPDTLGYMEVECPHCENAVIRFYNLWDSTIKSADLPEYGWDANPWVWVIEFERISKEEAYHEQ